METMPGKDNMETNSMIPQTTGDELGGTGVKQAAAEKLHTAASFIRERASSVPAVGRYADGAAKGIEQAASYVEGFDVADVRDGASDLIRRYPLRSLAVGVGLGLMLGRIGRR